MCKSSVTYLLTYLRDIRRCIRAKVEVFTKYSLGNWKYVSSISIDSYKIQRIYIIGKEVEIQPPDAQIDKRYGWMKSGWAWIGRTHPTKPAMKQSGSYPDRPQLFICKRSKF